MKGPRHLSLSLAMETTTVRTAAGTYGGTSITAIGLDFQMETRETNRYGVGLIPQSSLGLPL